MLENKKSMLPIWPLTPSGYHIRSVPRRGSAQAWLRHHDGSHQGELWEAQPAAYWGLSGQDPPGKFGGHTTLSVNRNLSLLQGDVH